MQNAPNGRQQRVEGIEHLIQYNITKHQGVVLRLITPCLQRVAYAYVRINDEAVNPKTTEIEKSKVAPSLSSKSTVTPVQISSAAAAAPPPLGTAVKNSRRR